MHLTGLCMHVLHALHHDVTGWCMQWLHGLCCFDFVSDIPLSPATLNSWSFLRPGCHTYRKFTYKAQAAIVKRNLYPYFLVELETSSLYYKHITIVNDDSRVISKWCSNYTPKNIYSTGVLLDNHHLRLSYFYSTGHWTITKLFSVSLVFRTNTLEY
jgi:hypothetical protein